MAVKIFITNSERDKGTDYLEFQICESNKEVALNEIISVANITHWKESSLYVGSNDFDNLINDYQNYFKNGVHNNSEKGGLDIYGINYYTVEETLNIIEAISLNKPQDSQILIEFLNKAKLKSGFYILGV